MIEIPLTWWQVGVSWFAAWVIGVCVLCVCAILEKHRGPRVNEVFLFAIVTLATMGLGTIMFLAYWLVRLS